MSYEKKSFAGMGSLAGGGIGALIGALKSKDEAALRGAGHGALTGAGTGLGAEIGAGLGGLGGGLLGGLATLPVGGVGALPGALAGSAAGGGLGGYVGFKGSNKLQRGLMDGPLPYDEDHPSKQKEEKEEEKEEKEEKEAGYWSEVGGSVLNPLNLYGGSLIGGAAALATPTKSMKEIADRETEDESTWLKDVLIPGVGPYNYYKRLGNSIRGPEIKEQRRKSRAAKDGDGDGKVNDGTSKEKEASSCSSHSKPKKKKSKKVEKAALEIATKVAAYRQVKEKQAQATRIKLAAHVVRMDGLRQELDKYDPYQLSKSAAVGARKSDRMKAAALVRQIELEKQAFVIALVRQLKLEKQALAGLGTGAAGLGMAAKMQGLGMQGAASPRTMKMPRGMRGAASRGMQGLGNAANVQSRAGIGRSALNAGMKASGNAANVQSKAGIGKSVPRGMKALGLDRLK